METLSNEGDTKIEDGVADYEIGSTNKVEDSVSGGGIDTTTIIEFGIAGDGIDTTTKIEVGIAGDSIDTRAIRGSVVSLGNFLSRMDMEER